LDLEEENIIEPQFCRWE